MSEVLKERTPVRMAVPVIILTILFIVITAIGDEDRNAAYAAEQAATLHDPWTGGRGLTAWDCVWFGHYPQSLDENGRFKDEPIKWRVLHVEDGEAFLLADRNLDVVPYHDEYAEVSWENCTLRRWLNDGFLNRAFNQTEQGAIAVTETVNKKNRKYGTPGGNDTRDRICILSIAEARESGYGFQEDTDQTMTRESVNTAYTAARAAGMQEAGSSDWWRLRSPGYDKHIAASVSSRGMIDRYGNIVNSNLCAVRPALHLRVSSDVWSYAGTVASNGEKDEIKAPVSENRLKVKFGAALSADKAGTLEKIIKGMTWKDYLEFFRLNKEKI